MKNRKRGITFKIIIIEKNKGRWRANTDHKRLATSARECGLTVEWGETSSDSRKQRMHDVTSDVTRWTLVKKNRRRRHAWGAQCFFWHFYFIFSTCYVSVIVHNRIKTLKCLYLFRINVNLKKPVVVYWMCVLCSLEKALGKQSGYNLSNDRKEIFVNWFIFACLKSFSKD